MIFGSANACTFKLRAGNLQEDAAGEAGHVLFGDALSRHPDCLQEVHAGPDGDLRGQRVEVDAARSAAVLHQAGGGAEEPQAERFARCPGISTRLSSSSSLSGGARS